MSPNKSKMVREKLNLTQEELSDLLGLSGRQIISHFETGFRTPSLLTQALLSVLDSLSERKAVELIELIKDHMKKIKRQAKEVSSV